MEDKTLAINTSLDRMVSDIEKNISSIFTNTYIISTVSSEMDSVSASSFYRIATVESILKSISNYSAEGYSYTLIDYSNHVYTNGSNLNLIQDFDGPLCSEIKKSPSDETYFTVRYAYTTNKKKTITFGRPLYVNGEVKAVLIVDISPELLDSIMDAYDTQNYFTIITNSSYDLIYASKNLSPDKFKSDYKMLFTDSDAPVNLGGTLYEKVHAQAFLSHCNTYILIPESLIFQDSSRMHWRTIIIILFILIQTLTFSEIVSRTLSRHIISLKDEVIRFINTREKMNFTSRKQDEIKEIADGILYMEEEVEKLISQIKQDEEKKRHLEFKVLQQQTNPHMIYNTLNTITKLAQLQGIRNIEEVSSSFTNMLKLIAKTEGDFITIRQEINFIQNYITLKKYNSFQDFSLTLTSQIPSMSSRF